MKGGFADSPLRINQGLGKLDRWTEDAIKSRAATLAGKAVGVWGAPSVPADVLDIYKPKAGAARYTIEDHQHLSAGPMRTLVPALAVHPPLPLNTGNPSTCLATSRPMVRPWR